LNDQDGFVGRLTLPALSDHPRRRDMALMNEHVATNQ
jgi:hypothetical protein